MKTAFLKTHTPHLINTSRTADAIYALHTTEFIDIVVLYDEKCGDYKLINC